MEQDTNAGAHQQPAGSFASLLVCIIKGGCSSRKGRNALGGPSEGFELPCSPAACHPCMHKQIHGKEEGQDELRWRGGQYVSSLCKVVRSELQACKQQSPPPCTHAWAFFCIHDCSFLSICNLAWAALHDKGQLEQTQHRVLHS